MTRPSIRDGRTGVDDAFVELPRLVYADDPRWIPEEPDEVRTAFSSANAWFAREGREAMVLSVPGRARAAFFHDPSTCIDGRRAAFFGYFEQLGAGDEHIDLFRAGEGWARERGAEVLYGPIDFSTFGRYRLRLDAGAATDLPFPGEPYNPTRYPAALARAGFRVARSYVTQDGVVHPELLAEKERIRREVVDAGYVFEPLTPERWMALLPAMHQAADAIFGGNFAYTPVSLQAFVAGYGEPVARRLCRHTSQLVLAPDGTIAGFLLVYPHYGPLVTQGAGGARVPLRDLSFDEHARWLQAMGHRTAIVKTVGVLPVHRGRGVMDAIGVVALERGRAHYDRWLTALIRADNPSRRFAAPHAVGERSYALYAKALS